MTGWKSWDLQSIHFLSLAKHTWSLSAYLWHCSIWQRILHHAVLKQKEHVKTQVGIFERSPEEESFCFVTQPSPENISVKRVQRTYNSLCSLNALAFIHKFKCRFLDCRSDYVQLLKSCVLEYKTAHFKHYSCVTAVFPTGLHLSFFPSSLCHIDVRSWSSGGHTAVLGEGDAAALCFGEWGFCAATVHGAACGCGGQPLCCWPLSAVKIWDKLCSIFSLCQQMSALFYLR